MTPEHRRCAGIDGVERVHKYAVHVAVPLAFHLGTPRAEEVGVEEEVHGDAGGPRRRERVGAKEVRDKGDEVVCFPDVCKGGRSGRHGALDLDGQPTDHGLGCPLGDSRLRQPTQGEEAEQRRRVRNTALTSQYRSQLVEGVICPVLDT